MKPTIFDKLEEYSASGALPMHMPGHKRRGEGAFAPLCRLDITEINGFDDLHRPTEIIKEAQTRAARLWGAQNSHILVNGSTCGILAGIYAASEPGDTLLIARNCHRSVYHAAEIGRLDLRFVLPESAAGGLFYAQITPEATAKAIDNCPKKPALAVITSPSYEGVISDLPGIVRVCRERGVPLMVDEAHGAHLDLLGPGVFPGGAVRAGSDIVIQSLHKTLSCLTQTAIAHVSDRFEEAFLRAIDIFETSSPSYLLIASAERCISELEKNREQIGKGWLSAISLARQTLARGLENMTLFGSERYDGSKFVIITAGSGISGFELASKLRGEYSIEVEAAFPFHIIAMSGEGDTEQSLARFAGALTAIDRGLCREEIPVIPPLDSLPERVIPHYEAANRFSSLEKVAPERAEGRICGEYILPYPPGVPIAIPGERLDKSVIERALSCERLLGKGSEPGFLVIEV